MGIQINGNTDTISAVDGGLTVSGADLGSASASSLNISGIVTASGGFSGNLTGTASTATAATTAYGLSGSPTLSGITSVSTTNLTVNGNAYPSDGVISGARNRIINGDMRIDQRNAGAAVTPSTSAYTLDRFWFNFNQASKITIQQNAASVITPAEFTNYLGATTASAYTPVSSDYFLLSQSIEGYNISDFGWGTASAQSVTISFWVRSSLTGTFSLSLKGGVGRNYLTTYSVSAANTWEKKVITIPGDTSGTWNTTNGSGLLLVWNLGTGPNRENSNINVWNNTDGSIYGVTGNVEPVTTLGATFYLTGVQLEAGTVATPFERRSYGQELALCQRYFIKQTRNTWASLTNTSPSNAYRLSVDFPTTMRANPTISDLTVAFGTNTAWVVQYANPTGFTLYPSPDQTLGGTLLGSYSASIEL